jgi:arylsulfatase A-like enzyme
MRTGIRCVLALLLVALTGCWSREPLTKPSRVLLISVDTLRRDHLGAYGYGRDTSPHLDRLAAGGVLIEDVFSVSPWTLPSHATMLTGLYPAGHGLRDDGVKLPGGVATLAEIFRDAAWHTFAVVSNVYVSRAFGFERGFEVFDDSLLDGGAANPIAATVVDRFLERLDAAPADRRWFAFLHFFDPHWDYTPPAPWNTRFLDPDYSGRIDGTLASLAPFRSPTVAMPPDDWKAMIALYDGEIAYLDAQIGRLFAELDQREMLEDLIVVFTSDHGEAFKEHGVLGHARTMFGEELRVPLFIWGTGVAPGRRGGVASTTDIVPTILGRVGLPVPDGIPGRDLLLAPLGSERVVVSETIRFGRELRAARLGELKAIHSRHGDSWLYFHLGDDPFERSPMGEDPSGGALRRAITDYLAVADRGWHLRFLAVQEDLHARFFVETGGRIVDPRWYFSDRIAGAVARFDEFELAPDGRSLAVDLTVSRHTGEVVFRTEPPDAPVTVQVESGTPFFRGNGERVEEAVFELRPGDERLAGSPRNPPSTPGVWLRWVADPGADRAELSEEATSRLKALGYIE